jgi:phage shock protein A
MSDFFKKLNVLVKAGLHDLIDTNAERPQLTSRRLGQNLDREVTSLRERINEALTYEDELEARVQSIQAEVDQLDQQADDAVQAGRDDAARQSIAAMQRAKQRLTMAEADLKDHRLVTQELITRVNELEAAVADAKRAQPETPAEEPLAQAGQVLSDVLHEMQAKIVTLRETLETSSPPAEPAQPEEPVLNSPEVGGVHTFSVI